MPLTRRLLAVDDDAASAELIVRVAERCRYDAFATSDPRGVVALVEALKPEVLAVDISMPQMDGIDLFRLLAAEGFAGDVIIVSGQDEQTLQVVQRAAQVMGLRCPEVHQKPLDFSRLRATLTALNAAPTAA